MKYVPPRAILLDTNVWVDFFVGARPGHSLARQLILKAHELQIPLAYAVVSMKDIYYLVGNYFKACSREENGGALPQDAAAAAEIAAWACLDEMDNLGTAIPADLMDIKAAFHEREVHRDFEDDLIISAARRAHADCLVTSDKKLAEHSPVLGLGVAEMLEVLEHVEVEVNDFFNETGSLYELVMKAAATRS